LLIIGNQYLFNVGRQSFLDLLDDVEAADDGLVDVGAAVGLQLEDELNGGLFVCWIAFEGLA